MADFETHAIEDGQGWRARPFILAGIGVVAAVLVQQLIHRSDGYFWSPVTLPGWRVALAIGIATSAVAIGFSLERVRIGWAIGFAAAIGLVAGLVFYWNGEPGWGFFSDWRSASLVLALAIFVPLFQTARDEGAARFPYVEVHGHAWTNVVLWCACWGFTGIVFALTLLLAALFDLIGLHFLRDLLRHDWFDAALFGAAFGGALGLFRERDRVVRLLQRVVTAVLGVLAPVLGVGLLVFLISLPFTGLGTLWEATRATTPILLGCVIGALILANAVIGNGADEELHNPVLLWGAMALALAVLPLAVIAAIATGLRIGQYGLTPDRLWALTFVILACVYGLAYLVSLVRGRRDWADRVRPANLRMAFVVAGVALFLATPLLSFNAFSARDQVARLESGRIAPDKFDWAALAFDFGDSGRVALKRLTKSTNPAIAKLAADAATKTNRYQMVDPLPNQRALATLSKRMRIMPEAVPVPQGLRALLVDYGACGREAKNRCTLIYRSQATEAIVVPHLCIENVSAEPKKASAKGATLSPIVSAGNPSSNCAVARYQSIAGKWQAGAACAAGCRRSCRAQNGPGGRADRGATRSAPSGVRRWRSGGGTVRIGCAGDAPSASRACMSVDIATVKKIASLARIAITEDEAARIAPELDNIMGWIEQLGEVDTSDVAPMTAVIPNHLRLRDDVVTDGGVRDAVLSNAPQAEHGFFTVPKVIE